MADITQIQVGTTTYNIKDTKKINPNLLYNWYFVGGGSQLKNEVFPINQRGQTIYSGQNYCIDRWVIQQSDGSVIINNDGLSFTISNTNGYTDIVQPIARHNDILVGNKLTASILCSDNSLYTGTQTYTTSSQYIGFINTNDFSVISDTYQTNNIITIFIRVKNASKKIVAVKLEIGDTQTLAHQENDIWILNEIPDYNEEFYKCCSSIISPNDPYSNKSYNNLQNKLNFDITPTQNSTNPVTSGGIYTELNDKVSKSGNNTITGNLTISKANNIIISTTIDSSSTSAGNYWDNGYFLRDKNSAQLGYFRAISANNNGCGIQLQSERTINNNRIENYLKLLVDDNGNAKIQINHPDAWRSALGAAAASHSHGNISNAGAITADTSVANGDKIVLTDNSDSSKLIRSNISFDGSTTNKALTPKGTFESFAAASHSHNYLPIGGGTLTGNLTISNTDPYFTTKRTDFGLGETSTGYKTFAYLVMKDKNDRNTGYITTIYGPSKDNRIRILGGNYINGSEVYNYLDLGINGDGTIIVDMNQKAAWRSALGLATNVYDIKVKTLNATIAANGNSANITASPDSGYTFLTWYAATPVSFNGLFHFGNYSTSSTTIYQDYGATTSNRTVTCYFLEKK